MYVQNVYQRTLNLEMIYHVARVMLIKSTLFVETVVIKNPHIHQNNHRKSVKERRKFGINIQTIAAFGEIRKGLEEIENITRCLNMFSIGDPSYQAINEELLSTYEYVANKSMTKAAIEGSVKAHYVPLILPDAGLVNCEVLADGSRQKQRHSSLNGVVTAMSDGKCLDVHGLSKHCKRCRILKQKKDILEDATISYHQCNINYEKPSRSMEAAEAVEIFQDSVQKHKFIHNTWVMVINHHLRKLLKVTLILSLALYLKKLNVWAMYKSD